MRLGKRLDCSPGEKRNRLTLDAPLGTINGKVRWRALCDCGQTTVVIASSFRKDMVKSCGCWQRERNATQAYIDGRSSLPEYAVWLDMRRRCNNENKPAFRNYGARGITVCERWKEFPNFLQDMGSRPAPHYTLERNDNDKGYDPSNCCWIPRGEQNRNKRNNVRVTVLGRSMLLIDAETLLRVNRGSIHYRINNRGETHQQAVDFFAHKRGFVRGT